MPINQLRVREILIGRGWLEEEIRVFLEELEQRDDDLARKLDIELLRQATEASIASLRRETQAGFAQQTGCPEDLHRAMKNLPANHRLFDERVSSFEAGIQAELIEAQREIRRNKAAATETRAMERTIRRDCRLLSAIIFAAWIVVGVLSALHFFA